MKESKTIKSKKTAQIHLVVAPEQKAYMLQKASTYSNLSDFIVSACEQASTIGNHEIEILQEFSVRFDEYRSLLQHTSANINQVTKYLNQGGHLNEIILELIKEYLSEFNSINHKFIELNILAMKIVKRTLRS